MQKRKIELCWYCGERPRKNNKGALFCGKCERIQIKNVPRSELENYWMKI